MENNNPKNLEVGKTYWFNHHPSTKRWRKAKITRITEAGYPWAEFIHSRQAGIISVDSYLIKEDNTKSLAKDYCGIPLHKDMDDYEERYYNPRVKEYDAFIAGYNKARE